MAPPKSAKNPRAIPKWLKKQRGQNMAYFQQAAQPALDPADEGNPQEDEEVAQPPPNEDIPESPPIPNDDPSLGDFEEVDLTGNWGKETEEEEEEEENDNTPKPGPSSSLTQAVECLKRPSAQGTPPSKPKRGKISDEDKATWKFECPICGKRSKFKSVMDLHMQIHSDIRPYICTQLKNLDKSVCGEAFKQSKALYSHIKRVHKGVGKEKVTCQFCLRFLTRDSIAKHLKICGKDENIPCPLCPIQSRSEFALHKHIIAYHKEEVFECPFCFSSFTNKTSLDIHMGAHTEYRHICHLCPISYQHQRNLIQHLQEHHSTSTHKHICTICPGESSSFSLMRKFVQHLYSVHQSKGIPEDWEEIAEEEEEEMRVEWREWQDEGDVPRNSLLFGLKYEGIAIQLAMNSFEIYSKYTLQKQVRVEDPKYKSVGYMDGGLYEGGVLVGAFEVKSLSSLRYKSKEQVLVFFKDKFYKDQQGVIRARPNSLYYTQCVFYLKLAKISWIDLLIFNLGGPEKSGQLIRIRVEMDIQAENFFNEKILPIVENYKKNLKPGKFISYSRNISTSIDLD